ncbi:MAG: type II toxin-antitoxin system Phd/YefM family antitoxin [Caldilinea sp. CFX5]|nr:type II toxin-antitoxin system Phd/YefM family antitoxin [Caldilinea sp. CFX5]
MQAIQTESVSGFRNNYKVALTKVENGPVLLLQNSKATAVLVSVEEWNTIASRLKRLQQLEALAEAKRITAEMEADPTKRTSHEELKRLLLEKRAKGVFPDATN